MDEDFTVTPWEVKGDVDYDKLVKKFGTSYIDQDLLDKIQKHTDYLHTMLRRKIFFSHRDLNLLIDNYNNGKEFALYTGRGPSGNTHIGHLIPWLFTKHLQDNFGSELYFQITDDEKFLNDPHLNHKQVLDYTYDNALDIIALGFDPEKTFIFADTEYIKTMYTIAMHIAKKITFSTARSVFGFENSTNIGMIFYPALQAATCFLPSVLKGKNIPTLIPAAIDQDDYWRGIARDVAPKLGYPKPVQVHSKFLPGLGKSGKMSASEHDTAIFTTDTPEVAEKKIKNSFTGGRDTVEEQRKHGGTPEICPIYNYYKFLFEDDDKELEKIFSDCLNGDLLCGDDKEHLISKVKPFLKDHQHKREKAKDMIDKFMLKD